MYFIRHVWRRCDKNRMILPPSTFDRHAQATAFAEQEKVGAHCE
jgi:hypothetical protein